MDCKDGANFTIFDDVLPAGTYVINGITGASNSTYQLVRYNNNQLAGYITTGNYYPFTLTEETRITLKLFVYQSYNNLLLTYRINKDTLKDYEPYVGGQASPNPIYKQQIECITGIVNTKIQNKNLFDKNNANILHVSFGMNGVISSSSASSTLYIECNQNTTYTVSKLISKRFAVGTSENIPDVNTVLNNVKIINDSSNKATITSSENDKYLVVYYRNSTVDTLTEQEIRNSIQIEENSTSTEFVFYQEHNLEIDLNNEKLVKIDNVEDELLIDTLTGEVSKVEKIRSKILNGSENWLYQNDVNVFSTEINLELMQNRSCICDSFIVASKGLNPQNLNYTCCGFNPISQYSEDYFYIKWIESGFTSSTEFKNWLSEHNIELMYELKNPIIKHITTLSKQDLDKLRLFDDVSYIYVSTNLGKAKFKVKYIKNQNC